MTSFKNDKTLYSGEFYEIRLASDYKYNYNVVNTLTGVVEHKEQTLPDALSTMFALDTRLMEMLSEEEVTEIEANTAKAMAEDKEEPF